MLVHAGVADTRMWAGVAPLLAQSHELFVHEMRGFGGTPLTPEAFSHAADLEAALSGPAVLVGASYGGQVCLELASRRPDLVAGLVLLAPALPDHDWSPEIEAFGRDEMAELLAGRLERAVDLNVERWGGRLDDAGRRLLADMQRRAFELQLEVDAEDEEPEAIPLGRIEARTLVAVGNRDVDDFRRIGERLVAELPDAELRELDGAGHLPAMERPGEVAELILEFLAHDGNQNDLGEP